MYKFDKPNWEFWGKPGTRVRLWEGVCLITDMEPPCPFGHEIGHLFEIKNFPRKFREVWNILNRDENFSKLEKVGTAGRMMHSINLDDFSYWAMWKGFDLPLELKKIAERFKLLNERSMQHNQQSKTQKLSIAPLRIKPRGGDSLTPTIWEICYDLFEAGQKVTARSVMAQLKSSAEKRTHPLIGNVAGGVVYEYEKGDEKELDAEMLRNRIRGWRKVISGG